MELAAKELGLEVLERSIDRSELYRAEEIFFTGTAVEVAPVVQIDHRRVGSGEIGPITTRICSLYSDAVRGRLPQYMHWLWPAYKDTLVAQTA
jgi:branched-chain amino acid aminotransferase